MAKVIEFYVPKNFWKPLKWAPQLSVTKNFKIPRWEGRYSVWGAQFFNILNHPHFDQPDADIASPVFGSIINPPTSILGSFLGADASPRLIQLHASITF
jgi:hypothetical protein